MWASCGPGQTTQREEKKHRTLVVTDAEPMVLFVPCPALLVDCHAVWVSCAPGHTTQGEKKHRTLIVTDAEPMVLFVPCPVHPMDCHAVCGCLVGLAKNTRRKEMLGYWWVTEAQPTFLDGPSQGFPFKVV